MSLVAMILLQAIATPVPAPPSDEVVVIGERLKAWRGKVSTTIGITTCRTVISTGDKEIDTVGCTALKTCWAEHRPAYAAALKAKDATEAKRTEGLLGHCLKERRDALVADLVQRRAVAKASS